MSLSAKKLFGWSGMAHVIMEDASGDSYVACFLYHGPSRTLFVHRGGDKVDRIPPGEPAFILPTLVTELGWDLGYEHQQNDDGYTIVINATVQNTIGEFCRIPKRQDLSRCDLLVQLSLISDTASWNLPIERLCRRYNRPIERKAVATISRSVILRRRPEFFFRKVLRPSSLRKYEILRACSNKLNWAYIKKILKRPDVSIVVAKREISALSETCKTSTACMETREGDCKIPDMWSIFRALCRRRGVNPSPDEYLAFKTGVLSAYPDPEARNAHLCTMAFRPIGNVFGGICLFSEFDTKIVVWILCSDRALGKALLDHFKASGKIILIDTPLDEVVGFYEKCGFRFDGKDRTRMVYLPPATSSPRRVQAFSALHSPGQVSPSPPSTFNIKTKIKKGLISVYDTA